MPSKRLYGLRHINTQFTLHQIILNPNNAKRNFFRENFSGEIFFRPAKKRPLEKATSKKGHLEKGHLEMCIKHSALNTVH